MKMQQGFVIASLIMAVSANLAFADTVALGKIEFLADTNVKMFKFKGDAGQLQAKLDRAGNLLKHVELTIPVQSLKTGMDLRDKHMRERIFTKADGTMPDIVFKADQATCAPDCVITGTLTIRGETRPQKISLSMKNPDHVEGHAAILLSAYGIEAPSQVGVKVNDNVDVNFAVDLK
jgi:polyisoprenoid-binding protein YceI